MERDDTGEPRAVSGKERAEHGEELAHIVTELAVFGEGLARIVLERAVFGEELARIGKGLAVFGRELARIVLVLAVSGKELARIVLELARIVAPRVWMVFRRVLCDAAAGGARAGVLPGVGAVGRRAGARGRRGSLRKISFLKLACCVADACGVTAGGADESV